MKREQGPASRTSPHSGHRARLRQRLSVDPLSVADYELLELLLGYGLTRRDTKPLAKELLARFTSLRGVLDARPDELLDVPGFEGILIHRGNTAEDTAGCILVGENKEPGKVVNSGRHEEELTRTLKEAQANGEEIWLEIEQ